MIKITQQEADRLGISPKKGKATKKASGTQTVTRPGRQKRGVDAGFEFDLDVAMSARPKARARTYYPDKVIRDAFLLSGGSADAFVRALKSKTSTPKATRQFERDVRERAQHQMIGQDPLRSPCAVHIDITLPGKVDEWPVSPADGDLDNLEKAILDALNGVVYEDDRLIVKGSKTKQCGPEPAIKVHISGNPDGI